MKQCTGYAIEKIKVFLRFKKKYRYVILIVLFFATGDFMNWYRIAELEANKIFHHDWAGVKFDLTVLAWIFGIGFVCTLFMKFIKNRFFPFIGEIEKKFKV